MSLDKRTYINNRLHIMFNEKRRGIEERFNELKKTEDTLSLEDRLKEIKSGNAEMRPIKDILQGVRYNAPSIRDVFVFKHDLKTEKEAEINREKRKKLLDVLNKEYARLTDIVYFGKTNDLLTLLSDFEKFQPKV